MQPKSFCVRSLHIHVEYFLLEKQNKILLFLKQQNRITRKRQVHGVGKRHSLCSAKKLWAVPRGEQDTCTALSGTWPGASLPPAGTQPTGQGRHGGAFSEVGREGERDVGEGMLHSYSSQACLVRRITFNEFLSCSFRCSSTAEKI